MRKIRFKKTSDGEIKRIVFVGETMEEKETANETTERVDIFDVRPEYLKVEKIIDKEV